MLGQQSLAEFLGLHLDIDAIAKKNKANRKASRKMGLIVNRGDKLTAAERKIKQAKNQELHGLSEEQVTDLKLPAKTAVQIFNVNKIVKTKATLTAVDKINHLLELQKALYEKLEKLQEQKKRARLNPSVNTSAAQEARSSSIEEDEETKQ